MNAIVRIVPPEPSGSGITLAQGTKVMVGETEIPRVFKVEIEAEAGGVWTAKIHCHVKPIPMEDMQASFIRHYKAPIIWRLKRWFRDLTGKHWGERPV
jgi:hypothetical protein